MGRYEKVGGVVIDHQTGLIWQEDAHGPFSWDDAMAYPETLGGGWIVPTIHELFSLVDTTRLAPASGFPGVPSAVFCSSTPCSGTISRVWSVHFANGKPGHTDKAGTYYVRCVRGGPMREKPRDPREDAIFGAEFVQSMRFYLNEVGPNEAAFLAAVAARKAVRAYREGVSDRWKREVSDEL